MTALRDSRANPGCAHRCVPAIGCAPRMKNALKECVRVSIRAFLVCFCFMVAFLGFYAMLGQRAQ